MLCRAVYVAIPVCVAGVILITQPSFLGHVSEHRSMLGVTLAVGQVIGPLHLQQLLSFHTSRSKYLCSFLVAVQPPVVSLISVERNALVYSRASQMCPCAPKMRPRAPHSVHAHLERIHAHLKCIHVQPHFHCI